MHAPSKRIAFHLCASAALASLLTGCGGGTDGFADLPEIPATTTAMLASLDQIADYCGIEPRLREHYPDPGFELDNLVLDSKGLTSALASQGANSVYHWNIQMTTPAHDYRGITTGGYTMIGSADPSVKMGVDFLPLLASGSVACLGPVSRMKPASPGLPFDPSGGLGSPELTLVWEGFYAAPIPIDRLDGHPVDGFQLVSNFTPRGGATFFAIKKTIAADAGALRICHLSPDATNWDCALPDIEDRDDAWRLTIDSARPGSYLLISNHAVHGA